jgi:cytoskeletal protein CcmA (bactofilin family)
MGLFRASANDGIKDFEQLRRTLRTAAADPAESDADGESAGAERRPGSNISVRPVATLDIITSTPPAPVPAPVLPTVRAVLRVEGDLTVDATVASDVEATGAVRVGPTGRVDGAIRAGQLEVAGQVVGPVHCSALVEVAPTGRIQGDLEAARLVVRDGGRIDGRVRTAGPEAGDPAPVAVFPRDRSGPDGPQSA